MRPVSPEFLAALRGSHRMVSRARLCAPGQVGVNPIGIELPVLAGDVQFDATADVRSTLSLTTRYPWPASPSAPFNPYGSEVFVERGIVHGTGVREWVALGYFRIYEIRQENAPDGVVTIQGRDRMSAIVDARVTSPREYIPGTSAEDIIQLLIREVLPSVGISFDFNPAHTTWPGNHILEEDRYAFLLDVVRSLGKVMYVEYDGSFRIESPPDPSVPLWTVNHGQGGVLVSASRTLTRDGVYNAVVAYGDRTGDGDGAAPVRAVALDLDPASPTYWHRYGQVPRFYSSSFITTTAQAQAAADAMLTRAKGLPYTVNLTAIPHPGIEPLDPVRVTYNDTARAEVHVLDQITLPLTPADAMTATTRKLKDV